MSIAYVNSNSQQIASGATGASLSITGLAVGHCMLMPILLTANSAGSWPTPALTGWTPLTTIDNGGTASNRLHCLWKVADASDVASGTFAPSWGASPTVYDSVAAIIAYSGTHATAPIDTHDVQVNAAATTAIAKALSLGYTSEQLVCVFSGSHGNTATTTNPFTGPGGAMSDRIQVAATGGEFGRMLVSDEGVTGSVASSTGTRTASIGGSGNFGTQCLSILLREAVGQQLFGASVF